MEEPLLGRVVLCEPEVEDLHHAGLGHQQVGGLDVEDEEYLGILAADLDAIETRCDPQLVCYLAGVDPYQHDQLGGLKLTKEGLERRDRYVFDRFVERGIPIAVLLAGGYARTPQETCQLHAGTVRAAEAACVA